MPVRVTIDTSPLVEAVINMLNRAGRDWYDESYRLTPVRKPQEGKEVGLRAPAHPVRLARASQLTNIQARLRRSLSTQASTRAAEIGALRGHAARAKFAQLFRYTEGPQKGQAPEIVATRGSKIVGVELTRGGTLKAGLELIPARREGNLVTVTLQNKVPYAAPQEYGFKHKGTGQIPGRRFMRGPRDNKILPGLREGRYLRG